MFAMFSAKDNLAQNPKRSTLRQNKYRKVLFDEPTLLAKKEELRSQVCSLENELKVGRSSEAEICAKYIFNFLQVMRPHDFLGGPHQSHLKLTSQQLESTVEMFAVHSFRSVPLAVNRTLVAWAEGRLKLILLAKVPGALELLELQAQGLRVVTCEFNPELIYRTGVHGRDPLGFVLHDLIHADHFFRDPKLFNLQREFYSETLIKMRSGEFNKYLMADPLFKNEFDYVIGDMNSHPEHLRSTLNHIFMNAQRRLSPANDLQGERQ